MENRIPKKRTVTRRDFVKGAALGTLGLALGLGKSNAQAQSAVSQVVLIRKDEAVDAQHNVNPKVVAEMIDAALLAFRGEKDVLKAWRQFIRPEDTVGVKYTRCSWMRIQTEQAVVDAITQRLTDVGVQNNRIYAQDGGLPAKDCTVLINVPTIKVHTLAGLASCLKNYINFSPQPSAYHEDKNDKLGEVWHLPDVKGKTRLIIVDALRPYFGPGPQINPLHRWDYKGIMVSTDPVALDATSLSICKVKRRLFKGEDWPITPPPKLIAAADTIYHLGTSDPAKIKLIKLGWKQDILI